MYAIRSYYAKERYISICMEDSEFIIINSDICWATQTGYFSFWSDITIIGCIIYSDITPTMVGYKYFTVVNTDSVNIRQPCTCSGNSSFGSCIDIRSVVDRITSYNVCYTKLLRIDKDGTVRHAVINDLPLGRNIDEMIRMVDTMLFTNEHGEVCPAGWSKGDEGMKANTAGVAEYLAKHEGDL